MRWRNRLERVEGVAFDAILIGVATTFASPQVRAWLRGDPELLYQVTALLHVIACPSLLVAVVLGHGKAGSLDQLERKGPDVLAWAVVLLWCGSFVIPGVLGLLFKPPLWMFMGTVFAPVAVFPLWMWIIVVLERRGVIQRARVGEAKPWWSVQALAVLGWGYLIALEMMLIVASTRQGPLVEVGLPLGILIDYLPVRVVLYYIRHRSRWELATMVASVVYLFYRLATT
jgi:hypothetical protein